MSEAMTVATHPRDQTNTGERPETASRSRRASLNSVAATLDYGTRILVSFLVKPLLVAGLGSYGFGAWEVLGRLVGYLGPATGRTGHALRWMTANEQSSTDYDKKRQNVGSALTVWLMLTPVFCVLSVLIAYWAPYWLKAPAEAVWAVRLTALVLGLNVAITSLVDIPRSVLEGENLGYKRMGASAILVAVGGGLTAAAVWLDLGLVGVAAATAVTSALTILFFLHVVRKQVPWFGINWPTFAAAREFFQLSGWFVGWSAILRLMRASDVVVLGMFATVELVTVYSLTKYAPEIAINLVAIVVFGITPGLGGIIGAGELTKASRIRSEIMAFTWLIATVAGVTTLLWNRSFLHLWVGDQFNAGSMGTLLMVVMVTQFVFIRNDANIIDLTLDLRSKVLIGLTSAVISLSLAAVLVGFFDLGIEGLCLGIIAGRVALSIAYPWIIGRFLGNPLRQQVFKTIRPGLMTVAAFALAIQLGSRLVVESWLLLVLGVGITLLFLPVPLFVIGMGREIRVRISQRLYTLIKNVSFT